MGKLSDKKQMIQKGFDTLADGYDHSALCFFPQTASRMLELVELQPEHHLIDICTGTGVVAIGAAEKLHCGQVLGIDLSQGMLQRARSKAAEKQLQNIQFQQMDMEQLTGIACEFDIASCSFGLFFLDDIATGLKNIAATLKPAGRIVFSSFTGGAFAPLADIFVSAYESTGREVGETLWKRLGTRQQIQDYCDAAGLELISVHHEALGYRMSDCATWWEVLWNSGWRGLLNELPEQELADFKRRHLQQINDLFAENGIWFNTEVLIGIAQKPA